MLTKEGPMVIEFNARFGDPETQSYMRVLESDLFDILSACVSGSLKDFEIKWSDRHACCIVLASKGYPSAYEKGIPIMLPAVSRDVVIFHAGTTLHEEQLVTNGGRVLGITATGETLEQALEKAYDSISSDIFDGAQYRRDIGETSKALP